MKQLSLHPEDWVLMNRLSADQANVPLGFISLTENLMMVAMAIWMAAMSTTMTAT